MGITLNDDLTNVLHRLVEATDSNIVSVTPHFHFLIFYPIYDVLVDIATIRLIFLQYSIDN